MAPACTPTWPAALRLRSTPVTVLIAAHNEEAVIAQSIESLLEVDYPLDRLQLMPVNDRSKDRTREIIDICRLVWKRERVTYNGKYYTLPLPADQGTGLGKPLKMIAKPIRENIPVWIASLGPKNVAMTAEIADAERDGYGDDATAALERVRAASANKEVSPTGIEQRVFQTVRWNSVPAPSQAMSSKASVWPAK